MSSRKMEWYGKLLLRSGTLTLWALAPPICQALTAALHLTQRYEPFLVDTFGRIGWMLVLFGITADIQAVLWQKPRD